MITHVDVIRRYGLRIRAYTYTTRIPSTGNPAADRAAVQEWLQTYAVDFSSIVDFSAYLDDHSVIEWAKGTSASRFYRATS